MTYLLGEARLGPMAETEEAQEVAVFPLPRVVMFPATRLPLHIFEPRYRALVSDALARDRRIAMIEADPEWNEGAAKAKLLKIFEAVGLEDPWAAATRRKLSLLLFG